MIIRTIARGVLAGLAGFAAAKAADALLQRVDDRHHTSEAPAGPPDGELSGGHAALLGAARAMLSQQGMREPLASASLAGLSLLSERIGDRTRRGPVRAAGDPAVGGSGAAGGEGRRLLRHGVFVGITRLVADALEEPETRRARRARDAAATQPQYDPVDEWHAAAATGDREGTLQTGPRAEGRGRRRSRQRLPTVSAGDAIDAITGVMLPTFGKGLIIRRPRMVALAERLDLDGRAVRRMQRLRAEHGERPIMFRNILRPHRHMALIVAPEDVRRVLDGTPDPFATASREKRGALSHFEPKISLASHGRERHVRARFNDQALDADRHAHRLADSFIGVVDEAGRDILRRSDSRGELVWEDWYDVWFRMVRELVFGAGAREDRQLIDMIERLRSRGNWSFLAPPNRRLRGLFLGRVRRYLQRAEPGSIAGVIAGIPTDSVTAPEHQVPQWLFAFDPVAMATYRTLELLAAHPEHLARAQREIRESRGDGRKHLPFLRACVAESLRLWPTAPLVLRETTRSIEWDGGVMPAHTHVVLYAPFFHRDDERLEFAHRFAPEIWLEDGSASGLRDLDPMEWPLIPFSSGDGMCPGRHVVLLVASNMLASLLDGRDLRRTSHPRLDRREPLPGTLDNYRLRFALDA